MNDIIKDVYLELLNCAFCDNICKINVGKIYSLRLRTKHFIKEHLK
jgi:hypothetical protein